MADVFNDEYLHRKPGRGAVTPADPLEVGLYGPNEQPISQSNPLEVRVRDLETEIQQLRGLLESGDAKVTLTGSLGATKVFSQATIPAETADHVLVVEKESYIHGLTVNFDIDHPWVAFQFLVWNGSSWSPYNIARWPGNVHTDIRPGVMKPGRQHDNVFAFHEADPEEDSVGIITLRQTPLHVRGFRVRMINSTAEEVDTSLSVLYSEVGS